MTNPIVLFNKNNEYITELYDYLTQKDIETFISTETTSAKTIKEMHNKGYTVLAINDSNINSSLKGFPIANISDIDINSLQDVINYIEPYYFSYDMLIKDFFISCIKASDVILDIYKQDFSISYKVDSSPVTEADKKSNEIIVNYLKSCYPDYAILAEETYDDKEFNKRINNPYCLIIDPLDGTKEFVKKNDEFTINIALSYKNRAIAGMIYLPVFKEIYYAARGQGAFHVKLSEFEDNMFNESKRIFVSNRLDKLIVMHSKSNLDKETLDIFSLNQHKIGELVSKGSAIKMCKIAEGCADIYYRKGYTMEWDTAAGQIIIEEAGGIMRQLDESESELLYNRVDSTNRNGFFILNDKYNKLKTNLLK